MFLFLICWVDDHGNISLIHFISSVAWSFIKVDHKCFIKFQLIPILAILYKEITVVYATAA